MTVLSFLKAFRDDESGEMTVDWVVLTAAVVGLGIAVLASVSTGTHGPSENVSKYLSQSGKPGAF